MMGQAQKLHINKFKQTASTTTTLRLSICYSPTVQRVKVQQHRESDKKAAPNFQRQVSSRVNAVVPEENWLLGSDSHVTTPFSLRIYLYSTDVVAGTTTVAGKKAQTGKKSGSSLKRSTHCSKSGSLPRTAGLRCRGTSLSANRQTR